MFIKVKVNSSAINNVSYDADTRMLRLEFKQGREYDYPDVPENEFHNLVNAESVGKYYNAHIKQYAVRRV